MGQWNFDKKNKVIKGSFVIFLLMACAAFAEILHVDPQSGDDSGDGSHTSPLRSTKRAVELARPGDTIFFLSGPLYQDVIIKNKSGGPQRPIIIDGNNQTLVGSRVLEPSEWARIGEGIYQVSNPLSSGGKELPASMLGRFFFVVDGRQSRMNRTSKGAKPPLPAVDDLRPGEWTYADGAFYMAFEPGKTPADHVIEAPVLQDGVAFRGNSSHWVVRNLNIMRFINDGINLHEDTRDILVENVLVEECGDDGMSAHETCEVEARNFIARRNSTGICHINESVSQNTQVLLEGNYGVNLYLLGCGRHEFTSSRISAHGAGVRIKSLVTVKLFDCMFDWPNNLDAGKEKSWQQEAGARVEGAPAELK